MPYVNKKRPYKKEYKQQKERGEHKNRMERQRARRKLDKEKPDRNKNGKACNCPHQCPLGSHPIRRGC